MLNSSIIRVLDEQTINQIKAGEVVENPASVIKELVENSIDAKATNISIETLGSGRQLIRIVDNGIGMSADDALLCIERHATSKIKSVEDLSALYSMGFRGEALASIAAVAKIKILTCQDNTKGTLVVVEGGKILQHSSSPAPQGTTIEVKTLFYNVPARRKFQKSLARDSMEIVRIVSALALAHPHVNFQLIINQKLVFKSPAQQDIEVRTQDILGNEFAKDLTLVSYQEEDIQINGLISLPHATRPNRSGQYLFINQRFVTVPFVSFAVLEGYGTHLSKGRHPNFVLHLTLPPHLIDANVHPQKKEVRLRHESQLRLIIAKAIERALHKDVPSLPWEDTSYQSLPPNITASLPSFFSTPIEKTLSQPTLFITFNIIGIWASYILIDAASMPETFLSKLSKIKAPFDGLFFIDQKLAYKRIVLESIQKEDQPLQDLLIPLKFEFSPAEALLLEEQVDTLNSKGIAIRSFGPHTFLVDALSPLIPEEEVSTILHEALTEEPARVIAKAASSKTPPLNHHEARTLIEKLILCPNPEFCPDGKPVLFLLRKSDLN